MKTITVYAVIDVEGNIITTTKNRVHADEQSEILNLSHKIKSYKVVTCKGIILLL